MADYNDYQLEEMENSAVEKSSMAKRAAAAAGLVGAGAATAYGASRIMESNSQGSDNAEATDEDLTSGAQAGAIDENSMGTSDNATQTTSNQSTEEIHVHHHYDVVDKPVVEEEQEMEFESTTHWYDEEGNLIGQTDEGTYDGKAFTIVDVDNDGHGDYLAYDVNGDNVYQANEITSISDYNYAMGHGTIHYDKDINTGEELYAAHEPTSGAYDIEKNDIADIHNDFDGEKAGEKYDNDLAQYNPDYRNNENLENQYSAEMEETEEYAYEESDKYDDSETIEEKYELSPETSENELAYDDTDTDNYAPDNTSDLAYDDTEDDTSDFAYDDTDTIDDTAQYDIV